MILKEETRVINDMHAFYTSIGLSPRRQRPTPPPAEPSPAPLAKFSLREELKMMKEEGIELADDRTSYTTPR